VTTNQETWGRAKALGLAAACMGAGCSYGAIRVFAMGADWSTLVGSFLAAGVVGAVAVCSVRPKAEKPVHMAWGCAFFVATLVWLVV